MADVGSWHEPMTDDGQERCVYCGVTFGKEESDRPIGSELNLTYGPVVRVGDGSEFETVTLSDPGDELVHPWCCWGEIEAKRRQRENKSLTQWSQ